MSIVRKVTPYLNEKNIQPCFEESSFIYFFTHDTLYSLTDVDNKQGIFNKTW